MKTKLSKRSIYILLILLSIAFGLIRYLFYNEESFSLLSKKEKINNVNIEDFKNIFDEVRYNINKSNFFYKYNEQINNYIDFEKAKLYNQTKMAIFIDARSLNEIENDQIIINDEIIKTIPDAIIIPIEDIEVIYDDTEYFYESLSQDDIELLKIDYENEMNTVLFLESIPRDINYIIYCGSNLCDKSQRLVNIMNMLFPKAKVHCKHGLLLNIVTHGPHHNPIEIHI